MFGSDALSEARYDPYKLASPEDDVRCLGGCGEDWDLCICDVEEEKVMSTTETDHRLRAAKEAAIARAHRVGMDDVVREIAKAGKYDGTANWHNDWDGKRFACTDGAGQNGARVTTVVQLYDATDYGRRLRVFRGGPWVNRAVAYAKELRLAREVLAAAARDNELRAELEKFKPWGD